MSTDPMREPGQHRKLLRGWRLRILLLAVATALLFGLLFVQVSQNTLKWFVPNTASETLILYALSTINFTAFVVLLMVLVNRLIKLRRERREMKLGARFKTRLVIFFVALSLLPVLFLFFATTVMINRSMDKWFSYPANEMVRNARDIGSKYVAGEQDDLQKNAVTFAKLVGGSTRENLVQTLANELKQQDLLALAVYDANGDLIAKSTTEDINSFPPGFQKAWEEARTNAQKNPSESVEADRRI